ncbi:hypothetical protein [Actinomadura mexicana]|uniref:Uncharacterized protein n=1 Tax=Actinomadura mexicana TaxID=134959 RepID=A0A238YAL4_9ACTN|nr:hypothetical protein [Actinomadura mexicana]SNR68306.1 hypothetical protein SAMN06265355_105404 [Actinomadura mexicana]
MTIMQQSSRVDGATGRTVIFTAWLNGVRPEAMADVALAEARDCFGSDAVLNVVSSRINPPGRTSLIEVAAIMSTTSPQVDEHVRSATTFRLIGNAMGNMERGAFVKARRLFGPDTLLRVVASRVEEAPGPDATHDPFLAEFDIAVFPQAAAGTRTCVLTLVDVITGNSIEEMERRARHEGRQFFGPDAELRVTFRDVCTTPERLGTKDRFFSMYVDVEAVLSGPPQFDERPCTTFRAGEVSGNSMRQMERRVLHKARQFFGPDAEYRVVFRDGVDGVQSTPYYIETKDRFYARSVDVEVILSSSAQVDEPAGEHVLTLHDTIRGNSRKQLEREALREARRRLGWRLGRGAVLQVKFRDGFLGATSDKRAATGRYFAAIVDVYASGGAA